MEPGHEPRPYHTRDKRMEYPFRTRVATWCRKKRPRPYEDEYNRHVMPDEKRKP